MATSRTNDELSRVLLSNRQYAALRMFTDNPRRAMDADSALLMDQRSFGSIFHKGWIEYNQGREGFIVTTLGIRAMSLYENTNVIKDAPSIFSHYIRSIKSLAAYHNGHGKGISA